MRKHHPGTAQKSLDELEAYKQSEMPSVTRSYEELVGIRLGVGGGIALLTWNLLG